MRTRIVLFALAAVALAACPKVLLPSLARLPPGMHPYSKFQPCSGDSQCDPSTIVCADPTVSSCRGGNCQYAVNRSNGSCQCFQNDIEFCAVTCAKADPSCRPVQVCNATGASSAAWGPCVTPAGCPTDGTSQLCDTGDASCPRGTQTFSCAAGWGACQKTNPCLSCGTSGTVCCGGAACDNGLSCQQGQCTSPPECGQSGEPCCVGQACANGFMCNGTSCVAVVSPVACGSAGIQCCQNDSCGAGLVCLNHVCGSCGNEGQACCAASKCNGSLQCAQGVCRRGTTPPPPCGGNGESCCATGAKCTGTLICQSGKCAPPVNLCQRCQQSYDRCIGSCNGDATCECLCRNSECMCRRANCGQSCQLTQC